MPSPNQIAPFVPHVWVFLCDCCLKVPELEKIELAKKIPPQTRLVDGLCQSQFDTSFLKKAFREGADGVILFGCLIGRCQNSDNVHRLRIIFRNQLFITKMGLDPNRLGLHYLTPDYTKELHSGVDSFFRKIQKLGPAKFPETKKLSAES